MIKDAERRLVKNGKTEYRSYTKIQEFKAKRKKRSQVTVHEGNTMVQREKDWLVFSDSVLSSALRCLRTRVKMSNIYLGN